MNISKSTTILAIICIVGMTNCFTFTSASLDSGRRMLGKMTLLDSTYIAWRQKRGKSYGAQTEETYRKEVFAANFQKVLEHNAQAVKSYTKGLNKFSDLTNEEFKQQHQKLKTQGISKSLKASSLPATDAHTKDWNADGCVTPVKDQGTCGSCFDFSAIGAIEGAHCKAGHTKVALSEQYILDCETGSTGDQGCNGGLMHNVFTWLETSQNKIPLMSDYPYQAEQQAECNPNSREGKVGVSAWGDINIQIDGLQLCAHLNKYGPISVAIQGAGTVQAYQGGIIDDSECGEALDHGVTLVGCVMTEASTVNGHGLDCKTVPAGNERMWCNKGRHAELMEYKQDCLGENSGQTETQALECANDRIADEVDTNGSSDDVSPEVDYFIVKNSWGSAWGEEGFFRVKPRLCGMHLMGSYVEETTAA